MITVLLIIGLIIMTAIAGYAIVYALRFGNLLLVLETQIEQSLDVLDSKYSALAKILATPLASDDPYARAVLSAIKDAHEAVLLVANLLTKQPDAAVVKKDDGDKIE